MLRKIPLFIRDISKDATIYPEMIEAIKKNPELKKAYKNEVDIQVGTIFMNSKQYKVMK